MLLEDPKTGINPGEFPFEISQGPDESRYLTWLRNNSNYMAVRGAADYLRAVGVLLRGVLINLLILVPFLLGISLLVAASNLLQTPPPFIFTKGLLIIGAAWVLLFPLLMPLFRIVRYRTSRATGSDSTIKHRDLYERSFGAFLLAIIAVVAIESLPGLLSVFHDRLAESDFGWPTLASAMAAATVIFSASRKILSVLGKGIARHLALVAVGALGVLVPLLFVLFVSDFLVFGPPRDWTLELKLAGRIFPIGMLVAIALGVVFGAFRRKDLVNICLLLLLAFGLLGIGIYVDRAVQRCCLDTAAGLLNEAVAELPKHPEELRKLTVEVSKTPGLEFKALSQNLEKYREFLTRKHDFFAQPPPLRLKDLRDYLDRYREFRAKNVDFYDVEPDEKKLLEELLGQLITELANEAYNVEGLSSLVELADTIKPSDTERSFDETVALMNEVYDLYHKSVTLRDLYRPQSLRELATDLIVLPLENIVTLNSDDYPALQQKFSKFSGAEESLASWGRQLKDVRDELDAGASYTPTLEFFQLIELMAERPESKLRLLSKDLEEYRDNLSQTRYLFAQQPVDDSLSFQELLSKLANAGYRAGLYPEFGELVDAIKKSPITTDELKEELNRLYSSTATLLILYRSRSMQELATNLITLPDEEIYDLSAPEEYSLLQKFDKGDIVIEKLSDWGYWVYLVRDELAATASILPSYSTFYTTPVAERVRVNAFWPKFIFVLMLAIQLWFLSWLTMDVNLTSIHGLYRDRLASAFLVGQAGKDGIAIEKDLDLMDICRHEAGSTAPYHLINVALNLQGSKDIGIRDRNSDFFVFSKKFIGGKRTGYCRSEDMEQVFPQMDLATAMAISAGAASPNMGRGTSPALVAIMTLLNIRLGFWLPNPGLVEQWLAGIQGREEGKKRTRIQGSEQVKPRTPPGFRFDEVFEEELDEIEARWAQAYDKTEEGNSERRLAHDSENQRVSQPTPEHGLVGIGYSGGGIRSATLNLGITQALYKRGVFDHVDYMSTVSGGGYLGSSISSLMRQRPGPGGKFSDTVKMKRANAAGNRADAQESVSQIFRWRVRPVALMREILSKLDEKSRLVNVSDGGHIENLAGIELLRRRCKYIIIGDAEADPNHHFNGLATLIRSARIDLGVHIHIKPDPLRLVGDDRLSPAHWAIGRIQYPGEKMPGSGYLLYLKSSVTGEEDEVIQEYRHANPAFPHESTADQFFSEGQFEAYRSLGQHIGEQVLEFAARDSKISDQPGPDETVTTRTTTGTPWTSTGVEKLSFTNFVEWLATLDRHINKDRKETSQDNAVDAGDRV